MKRGVSLMLQHHCAGDNVSALGSPKALTTFTRSSGWRAHSLALPAPRRVLPHCSAASCKALKRGFNSPPPICAIPSYEHCWSRSWALVNVPLKSSRRHSQDSALGIWREHEIRQARGAAASARMASSASGGPPEGYRANVGVCVINSKNEVFVASRLDIPDSWQMPQGGVDDGEEPRAAAFRELKEETGVSSVQMIGEVPEWLTYDFPPEVKAKITRLWGREWFGQAQKWFLFRFQGDESEIDLNGDGSEQPEFGDWKWLPAEEVLNKAVDFKRPVYAQAFKALAVHVDTWAKL